MQGTNTGPRSKGCARRGASTGTSTPRSRCVRRTCRKRHASRSIPRCWTPRCIRWSWAARHAGRGAAALLLPRGSGACRRCVDAAGAVVSAGEGVVTLTASDAEGRPVAAVESLALRPASPELLRPAGAVARRLLFGVEWQLLDPQPGGSASGRASCRRTPSPTSPPTAVRMTCLVRLLMRRSTRLAWCSSGWPRSVLSDSRLVVVVGSDLVSAPVRGLIRSAQSEHPGRFVCWRPISRMRG